MDTNKKFLFCNPDITAAEYDTARMFPVSRLQGVQELNTDSVRLAFADFGLADDTLVDITVTDGTCKDYINELFENINYGKDAMINLADASDNTSFANNVDFGTAPAVTLGSA
jgi:hypothetical protein